MNDHPIEMRINDYISQYFLLHGVLPEEVNLLVSEYREFRRELERKLPVYEQNRSFGLPTVITYHGMPIKVAPYSDIKTFWEEENEEIELLEAFDNEINS